MLYRGAYTRDNGGRLDTRTETIGGVTATDAYGYDLAGRLTTVTRGGAPLASYTFDANGNRTSVTTSSGTISATYDDQDRILTFGDRTYTHTAHGEVRSWADASGTTTLTYDVQGNLLAVNLPSGTAVEYIVDARNRRIGHKVNGVVTHRWLYQGQLRPIAELNATGAIVSRFIYGARAVAPEYMIRGGVTYRLITDHIGNVRLVVNNTTGATVQRIDYDAWGHVIADTNPGFQPFGFAGGLYDPSTRLLRFGARDYDPSIGRWLAKDPTMFAGLDPNTYQYAYGEPINWRDSEGTFAVGAVAGGIIGAISGFSGSALAGGSLSQNLAGAFWGGAFGAIIGALDPTEGALTISALMTNAQLNALAGLTGNILGQVTAGRALLCLDLPSALVSGAMGALGGAFNKLAVESAQMIAVAPLGILTTTALQTVGGGINAIGEAVSNAMQRGRR